MRTLVVFTVIEGSECAKCKTFPQQIGPVEDNLTIAYTLSAFVSYQ
jgi:hypothetical protein